MTGYIPLGVLYIYPDVTCIEIKAISPIIIIIIIIMIIIIIIIIIIIK